jgi:iron complex outermembrane receptor protein
MALFASPAAAQRTDDNATTQAEDAFGQSVGDQVIGIYNPYDVRGFSPVDAGNVRIEGLYFDRQAGLSNQVSDRSTIRVGLSAQSYPFPAPTGIADFTLRRAGSDAVASLGLDHGPWGGNDAELDVKLPLDGERLGLAAGIGLYRDVRAHHGTPREFSAGATLHWAPRPGTEIIAFWSRATDRDDEVQPLIFTSGDFLPRRIRRDVFLGQSWADYAATATNYGLFARTALLGFDTRLGLFRSVSENPRSVADLLLGSERDGSAAQRILIVEDDDKSASTSGELRATRSFDEGPRRHSILLSLRGRAQDRQYGGGDAVDLGPSRYDRPDERPMPIFAAGPKTRDHVRQATIGLGYQLRWRGLGEFSIGAQRTHYTKTIAAPDPLVTFPTTREERWLPSATFAAYLTPGLVAYVGYTEGLEESPVAPIEAANFNEAPPAVHTRQRDGGLRWNVSRGVTAVIGLFDVSKPYFNIDPDGRFRRLGSVRNRGLEVSIAGQVAPGLNIVAGNTFIDARVSGELRDSGLIGKRPVGTFVRHTIVSVDYRLPFWRGLSVDAFVEATSRRIANVENTLTIPARAVLSLGARYRFNVQRTEILLRAQVQNVMNTFGWNNGGSGYFIPNGSRRFLFSMAADY